MLFPNLSSKTFGYVNLNNKAKELMFYAKQSLPKMDTGLSNPLLNPDFCEAVTGIIHQKLGLDFSYGGWLEDRSFLWQGSYLEKRQNFIHLGVDFSVPSGTDVTVDFDAEVVRIDDDYPEESGWGPRVIVRHLTKPVYLIYAHLKREICCNLGMSLKKGRIFANVGAPPYNGNGYGTLQDLQKNAQRFRDPLPYISFI